MKVCWPGFDGRFVRFTGLGLVCLSSGITTWFGGRFPGIPCPGAMLTAGIPCGAAEGVIPAINQYERVNN